MTPFIHDDFLLPTPAARRLYHEYAKPEPILDYHCHLSPKDIAENRQFRNLFEIWLEGDHYKWRAMRANGVAERYCTGDAEPREKFLAWAATVPQTLRNPLYHWTHLELTRYFGITELLDEKSAPRIWDQANEMLATPEYSTHGLLEKFNVTVTCTTDDPADDLNYHAAMAKSGHSTRMLPCFRPDAAFAVDRPDFYRSWVKRLGATISRLPDLLEALAKRVGDFHALGCRLSDHGLENCSAVACRPDEAEAIFYSIMQGGEGTDREVKGYFTAYLMQCLGRLYAKHGWTMQLHIGALRGNNTRLLRTLGPDTGFDSIGDFSQAVGLSALLDRLDSEDKLPKTIVYNLNPADNYVIGTMIGNFQDGTIPGKVQMGSGWWFLDQKEGMEWQLSTLSNLGLLSRFVGMVTDSRSFMSYPRHEYFRRTLCSLLGRDMEAGELPNDEEMIGSMVRRICHANARDYLNL